MNSILSMRYGWLGLSLAMLGIPLYVYLPTYYAQQSSLSLTAVGAALLLARSLDVITDPLIGWWSDKLQHRISRIAQIMMASPLLLIGVYQLWLPDLETLSSSYLFFWSFVTYLSWTAIIIPYLALSAEISENPHHKTLLSAYREGFAIVGVVLVLTLPIASGLKAQEPIFYSLLFWVFAFAFISAVLLLIRLPVLTTSNLPTPLPWHTMKQLWQHHPHVFQIMPSYFLNNLANALPATLFLLFVQSYLQLEQQTGLFLLLYFLAGLIALPFWVQLAKKIGKKKTWQASMLLASLCFIGVFWLEPGSMTGFVIISVLTGLSLGIDVAMPASIQADLTQKVSSHQASGLLFGLWGMLTKLALALAVGIAFPILEWSQNQGWQDQTMLLLYAGLPILLKLISWHRLHTLKLV